MLAHGPWITLDVFYALVVVRVTAPAAESTGWRPHLLVQIVRTTRTGGRTLESEATNWHVHVHFELHLGDSVPFSHARRANVTASNKKYGRG